MRAEQSERIERRAEHDPPGGAIVFEGAEIAWGDFRDQCVGAAGVSGGDDQQDQAVVEAAVSAL